MNPHTFEKMGARIHVIHSPIQKRWVPPSGGAIRGLTIDVRGDTFLVNKTDDTELVVLNADIKGKHLLLMARDESTGRNNKFLCGYDEREWFVASVPRESTGVADAKDRLMPLEARFSQLRNGVKGKKKHSRHNKGFIRQGEWFFIPAGEVSVDKTKVLKNEPLTRGGGSKPHMVQELYRTGGENVHVHFEYAQFGITDTEYSALSEKKRRAPGWRMMKRNPDVFAKGQVRHADHQTVTLRGWCRVRINREVSTQTVAFLD
ncbi:MAG: hypothetical protein ACPGN3_15905 [Opitutales bacterium]